MAPPFLCLQCPVLHLDLILTASIPLYISICVTSLFFMPTAFRHAYGASILMPTVLWLDLDLPKTLDASKWICVHFCSDQSQVWPTIRNIHFYTYMHTQWQCYYILLYEIQSKNSCYILTNIGLVFLSNKRQATFKISRLLLLLHSCNTAHVCCNGSWKTTYPKFSDTRSLHMRRYMHQ